MEHNYFIFDGKRSHMMGLTLQAPVSVSGAVPNITEYQIPGRNGTLHEWDGSYENRKISASCFFLSQITTKEIREANAWLLSGAYKKMILSDDEEHFYLSKAKGGISEEIRGGILNPFAIDFTAKPQKFLLSGEREIAVSSTLYNPTREIALPMIKLTGSGNFTLEVNGIPISFSSVNGSILFDAETGNATVNGANASDKVYFEEDISLLPGRNVFSFTKGSAAVTVIPRWFDI